jgi:hypothetical protein
MPKYTDDEHLIASRIADIFKRRKSREARAQRMRKLLAPLARQVLRELRDNELGEWRMEEDRPYRELTVTVPSSASVVAVAHHANYVLAAMFARKYPIVGEYCEHGAYIPAGPIKMRIRFTLVDERLAAD